MDKEKIYAIIWEFLYETLIFTQKILNILHVQFMWISNIWSNNHDQILMIHSVPVENSYLWWMKTYVYILIPIFFCYMYQKIDWFEHHYYRVSPKTEFEKYVQMEFTEIHLWFLFLLTIGLINRYCMTYFHLWDIFHSHRHMYYNHGEEGYLAWYDKVENYYLNEEAEIELLRRILKCHQFNKVYTGQNEDISMEFRHSADDFMFNNILQYGIHVWTFRAKDLAFVLNPSWPAWWFFLELQDAHRISCRNADYLMTAFFVYMREGAAQKWHWMYSDVILEIEADVHVSRFDCRKLYSNTACNVLINQLHYYSECNLNYDYINPSYCWDLLIETSKNGYIGSVMNYVYFSSFRYYSWWYPKWYWLTQHKTVYLQSRDAEEWYLFFLLHGTMMITVMTLC